MARKDLLKGLMGPETAAPADSPAPSSSDAAAQARVNPAKPRYTGGAIGAVSQSIANLKSRSVIEIDPHDATSGGLLDRLEFDAQEHERLMASIKTYGQQVPILVRPDPDADGKYQIVYGRRRVLAMRDLGLPIKALVRDLDDRELVMAQGQENTQRRDLSFIEKAHFAQQMAADDYDRQTISDALALDRTSVSRMLTMMEKLDIPVVHTIGSAPSVGRDRWVQFANAYAAALAQEKMDQDSIISILNISGLDKNSDDRFEIACQSVGLNGGVKALLNTGKPTPEPPAAALDKPKRQDIHRHGTKHKIARVSRTANDLVIKLPYDSSPGFQEWLVDRLPNFHATWENELVDQFANKNPEQKTGGTS